MCTDQWKCLNRKPVYYWPVMRQVDIDEFNISRSILQETFRLRIWRLLADWTCLSFHCPVVQTGALRWLQVCLHRSDQELSGWVRGREEDQPRCCGGFNESVGGSATGKHSSTISPFFDHCAPNFVYMLLCVADQVWKWLLSDAYIQLLLHVV